MDKGKLINIDGDATNPQLEKNEICIIPHICNNINVWGGGFVVALSKRWIKPEQDYHNHYEYDILGMTIFSVCEPNIIVASMMAQKGIISKNNPKPIKYKALINCMLRVKDYIKSSFLLIDIVSQDKFIRIHCPKFGSLRAGGNWDFILELIDEIWLDSGISVVVYSFPER